MKSRRPAPGKRPVRRRIPVVGLTGGIASGKSEVAAVFRRMGALVISADVEAKDLLVADATVARNIRRLLGPSAYTSGGLPDRAYIARRIFSNSADRRKVNAIVHPAVIARIGRMIASARRAGEHTLVVVEAALLFEAGMDGMFDAVVAVDSSVRERVGRITRRDGVSRTDAIRRIRAQHANSRKRAMAEIVVANRGDLRSLRTAARFVFRLLAGLER